MKREDKSIQSQKRISDQAQGVMQTALCCLFYALASVYIPVSLFVPMGEFASAALALGVCVLGIFVLALAARSFHAIITYAIIVGLFVILGGILAPIGLISAFISSACIFAFLIFKKKSPFAWGMPLIAVAISFLLFNSVSAAILCVSALPCSLLLAYSANKQLGRVSAVCYVSAGICLSVVALFASAVYSTYGEISIQSSKALIEAVREQLTVLLGSATEEIGSIIGYDLTSTDIKNTIELTVSSLFNLLPALIITFANIMAYVIHSLFLSINYVTIEEKKQAIPMLTFDMSIYSALIYIVSLVLSFVLVSENTAIYGTAAENLLLVLAPGLILTALAGIRALNAKKGPSCFGTLIYFAIIFMLVSLSPFAIIGVSLLGAILIIAAHITRKKSEKSN